MLIVLPFLIIRKNLFTKTTEVNMKILVLIATTLSFVFSQNLLSDDREKSKLFDVQEQLSSIVVGILTENNFNSYKENISPEAYIIVDNNYQSIFEVLDNPPQNFTKGKETIVGFIHIWLTDDNKAYMIMQTTTVDEKISWHSIFFKLSENDKWQILNWHKS